MDKFQKKKTILEVFVDENSDTGLDYNLSIKTIHGLSDVLRMIYIIAEDVELTLNVEKMKKNPISFNLTHEFTDSLKELDVFLKSQDVKAGEQALKDITNAINNIAKGQ